MRADSLEDLVERRIASMDARIKPRLRFDKVALRFLNAVRTALGTAVPEGTTVLLAITAPIRLPSKTALDLEIEVPRLVRRRPKVDRCVTIHGNKICIRIVKTTKGMARVAGFVHTCEPSAAQTLLDAAEAVLKSVN